MRRNEFRTFTMRMSVEMVMQQRELLLVTGERRQMDQSRIGGHELIYCAPVREEVYLVTALVPSETACLANSPGRRSRMAV
jgi:hypothetical protein